MAMIDADTHVDECEDTWKKLEGTPYAKYIPVTTTMPPDEARRASKAGSRTAPSAMT